MAALAIVVSHVTYYSGDKVRSWAAPVLSRLDLGVAVFFVLSGFLLYRSYATALVTRTTLPSTTRYLVSRAARILPAYWLAVLAAGLLLSDNYGVSFAEWLRQVTLTQIYEPLGFFTGLVQTWSLNTTIAFYILLPIVAWLAAIGSGKATPERARRRQTLLITTFLLTGPAFTVAFASGWIDNPTSHNWLPSYLGWFGAGMGIAVAEAARRAGSAGRISRASADLASVPGTAYVAAGLIFVIALTPVSGPRGLALGAGFEQSMRLILLSGVAWLLVLPATSKESQDHPLMRGLGTRPLRWLGDISYGVFLYHLVILELVAQWMGIQPFTGHVWSLLAVTLAIVIPVSWVSYRFFELPVQRWSRSRFGRGQREPRSA